MPLHLITSEKAKQTELSTTLLKSVREGRMEVKLLPAILERKTGGYRDSQITRAETHEQELLWQRVPR